MRAFFYSLLGYFLTPWGIILMGALDSSLIFFLPLGIDFAVIILSGTKARTVLALRDSRDDRLDRLVPWSPSGSAARPANTG